MTSHTLPAPFAPSRPRPFEQLCVVAAVTTLAFAGWVGARPAPEAPYCAAGDRVSHAQVAQAAQRVWAAELAWTAAAGPSLERARVGVPPGEALARAQAAAKARAAAQAAWARLCG